MFAIEPDGSPIGCYVWSVALFVLIVLLYMTTGVLLVHCVFDFSFLYLFYIGEIDHCWLYCND